MSSSGSPWLSCSNLEPLVLIDKGQSAKVVDLGTAGKARAKMDCQDKVWLPPSVPLLLTADQSPGDVVLAQWERRVTGKVLQPEEAITGRILGRALLEQLPFARRHLQPAIPGAHQGASCM